MQGEQSGVKRRDTLFLVGMILVLAAYLLPVSLGIYLYDFANVSKGTIYHGFRKPYAFYVITGMGSLTRIFEFVTIVSAVAGLIVKSVMKNERRWYITRVICSVLVFIGVVAWLAYVCLRPNSGLRIFSLWYLLEILGAVCALISLFMKPKEATKSAGVSSEKNDSPEQNNISLGGMNMSVSYVRCPNCRAAVEQGAEHCPKCGADIPKDAEAKYWKCPNCGMAVSNIWDSCPQCNAKREMDEATPVVTADNVSSSGTKREESEEAYASELDNAPSSEEWSPITMWGYFGYEILYMIPILGQLALLYNALAAKNENVKNFARSYFCLYIILAVLCILAKGMVHTLLYRLTYMF